MLLDAMPDVGRPQHMAGGAANRRGPRLMVRAAQLSVLAWVTEALSYYCLLVGFGWLACAILSIQWMADAGRADGSIDFVGA